MSIYATHWTLKFPKDGFDHPGFEWVEVIGQGVPAHIGTPTPGNGYESADPYASFLPPAVPVPDDYDGRQLRTMVIVTAGTLKDGQEYKHPLLVLSGREYSGIPFDTLYLRICEVLREGKPRLVAQRMKPDGNIRLMFNDGSHRDLPPPSDG